MPIDFIPKLFSIVPDETAELVTRVLVGAALGALVGLERDLHGRAAGLRTHLLVAMGAALFTVLSQIMSIPSGAEAADPRLSDPARIAAQIVTGIGFLGAGAILKDGLTIRGLTTAACLWVVAAVGMASGAGFFTLAIVTSVVALLALVVLKWFEHLYPKDTYRRLTVVAEGRVELAQLLNVFSGQKYIHVLLVHLERNYRQDTTTIQLSLRMFHRGVMDVVLEQATRAIEQSELPLVSVKWDH